MIVKMRPDGSVALTPSDVQATRQRLRAMNVDTSGMSDADIQKLADERARSFLEEAPTSASQAARIILDGVKAERWRIVVGEDAQRLDRRVQGGLALLGCLG